ncbi:MAG: hypothetical protein DRJ35_03385 [Thermoprotei archaeon]|nr:MAG: hypothetical protein DRJ35_03385 [Thermoprotei archaeon]
MTRYLLTTILGLEEALAKEVCTKNIKTITLLPSRVIIESDKPPTNLRVATRVLELLEATTISKINTLEIRHTIRNTLRKHSLQENNLETHVHGKCYPKNKLKMIAAREYKRVTGKNPQLLAPKLVIDLFCRENLLMVSLEKARLWTGKREYYSYRHPTPLNPIIAAAIPYIADIKDETLLDPMAGIGTIPIEASLATGNPAQASDINPIYIQYAIQHAKNANIQIDAYVADLKKHPATNIDVIATDPPRRNLQTYLRLVKLLQDIRSKLIVLVTPYPGIARKVLTNYVLDKFVATFQGGEKVVIEVFKFSI